MGVVARRPESTGIWTGLFLLRVFCTALTAFYGLGTFCCANEVPMPTSFVESLPFIQGWVSKGQDCLAAFR